MGSAAYTSEQVDAWLALIQVPAQYLRQNAPTPSSEFLRVLHAHHLCAVPFETLVIHYSAGHEVVIDRAELFRKFVGCGRGRGGYCMEHAVFFNGMLRALGFDAFMTGARVRPRSNGIPSGDYLGWVHAVNVVTLPDGSRWLSDVGYGGDNPVVPVPLDGSVVPNIGSQEMRVVSGTLPGQVRSNETQWIYQIRYGPDKEWIDCFAFPEQEFLLPDFVVMSFFTSKNPVSYMVRTATVVRFLHHGDYVPYGKRMLVNDQVKEFTDTKTVVVKTLNSEKERLECLEHDFGLTLSDEEQNAIYETELALS